MTHLEPTSPGPHPDDELLFKVADCLGYDLEAIDNRDDDYGGKCPCCQIDALMDLLFEERVKAYRKGWDHVVDGSTPPVPDLLFGAQLDQKALDDIAKQQPFCDKDGNLLKPKE